MYFIRNILVSLGLAVTLASCATSGVNKGDFNLVSMDQERAMGQQINAEVHQQYQVIDDPQMVAYLKSLGDQIAKAAKVSPDEFHYHIVKDPAVNAFAIPGGHVYVNTGLIEAAANESELAGVMAHEMGHVIARHGTEQLTKSYGLNIIGSLALGQNPGLLQQLAAQVGGTALMLHYTRGAEDEADKLAVKYTYYADIDPNGMVSFFKKLAQEEKGKTPPRYLAWLQTHPLTADRIKSAERRIAELPRKPVRQNSDAFVGFKTAVAERFVSQAFPERA
jgi:predicted Zn-dependent protease